jgi:integrase
MQSKPKISQLDMESKPGQSHSEQKDLSGGLGENIAVLPKPESKPKLSKTDVRFWRQRLFKRTGDDWHVQIAFAGVQKRFPLRKPNKDAAAAIARDIYLSLHKAGWQETEKRFKPWTNSAQKIKAPTVGQFIDFVEKHGGIKPRTLKSYTRKFRRLVAGLRDIGGDKSRYDRNEGSAAWRKKVDAVRISEITASAVNKWKSEYVAAKGTNPIKRHRAESTAQSILRNARSLFSKPILHRLQDAKVELQLPSPMPFDGIQIGKSGSHRYTSNIDSEQLARAASKELQKDDVDMFKIFLLAFGVGLRRGEIDRLTWAQFNWSKAQINVEITAHGELKTESSIAGVDVDPVLMKIFQKFEKAATSEFVIESAVKPRPGADWHHYRCNCAFTRLNAWLRSKGVDAPNPIHTLRKEFGTLICQKFGIFAASEALRHSDIRLTRAHYVDRRGRIHLEVGKMLGLKH